MQLQENESMVSALLSTPAHSDGKTSVKDALTNANQCQGAMLQDGEVQVFVQIDQKYRRDKLDTEIPVSQGDTSTPWWWAVLILLKVGHLSPCTTSRTQYTLS